MNHQNDQIKMDDLFNWAHVKVVRSEVGSFDTLGSVHSRQSFS